MWFKKNLGTLILDNTVIPLALEMHTYTLSSKMVYRYFFYFYPKIENMYFIILTYLICIQFKTMNYKVILKQFKHFFFPELSLIEF